MNTSIPQSLLTICLDFETSQENPHTSSISTTLTLSPSSHFNIIKNALQHLLALKKTIYKSPEYEAYRNEERYQMALQKVEERIRKFFKVEQQLKLHIESMRNKMDLNEMEHRNYRESMRSKILREREECDRVEEIECLQRRWQVVCQENEELKVRQIEKKRVKGKKVRVGERDKENMPNGVIRGKRLKMPLKA